jgi:hypothetical protein
MVKKVNIENIKYDINLNHIQIRILLVLIIILLIILLFRKKLGHLIERIILFSIIFLLILILSKNLIITIVFSVILFLLFNLLMRYRNTIENFQDLEKEPIIDMNIFNTDDVKKSKEGLKELLKKVNGGIKLELDDLKETEPLNIEVDKYKDDKTPNALKIAQKETYELINTVNALKDTLTTLTPVLQEGKKLMSMFENIKI